MYPGIIMYPGIGFLSAVGIGMQHLSCILNSVVGMGT